MQRRTNNRIKTFMVYKARKIIENHVRIQVKEKGKRRLSIVPLMPQLRKIQPDISPTLVMNHMRSFAYSIAPEMNVAVGRDQIKNQIKKMRKNPTRNPWTIHGHLFEHPIPHDIKLRLKRPL